MSSVKIDVEIQSIPLSVTSFEQHRIIDGIARHKASCGEWMALLESGEPGSEKRYQSMLFFDPVITIEKTTSGYRLFGHGVRGQKLAAYLSRAIHSHDHHTGEFFDEATCLARSPLFAPIRRLLRVFQGSEQDLRRCYLVGGFSFDIAAQGYGICPKRQENGLLLSFTLYRHYVHIDHTSGRTELRQILFHNNDSAISRQGDSIASSMELGALASRLLSQLDAGHGAEEAGERLAQPQKRVQRPIEDAEYCRLVNYAKRDLHAGEVFQLVLARPFVVDCKNPYAAYRILSRQNPSPYQFFLKQDDWILFGASPERALKVERMASGLVARLYPIAGTRSRGFVNGVLDNELDQRRECSLRTDEKEVAEHLMLVDLARNDLARVSHGDDRRVSRLLAVDRYSRVMHLVSEVEAKLAPEFDALSAFEATMHMGTLIGAPKPRALELIYQYETTPRGFYGGAVGHLNLIGELDTAIVIRSAEVRSSRATVMAGAGIVLDSVPEKEAQETLLKAEAVLRAMGGAL